MHGVSLATSLAVGAFVLAACGSSPARRDTTMMSGAAPVATASAQSKPAFDEADVMFAQMMIAHHQEAIEMAELATGRATYEETKELAEKIKSGEQPQIETLQGWLKEWGRTTPISEAGNDRPTGIADANVKTLLDSRGPAFDKGFLTMMIDHHEEAIAMARVERKQGQNSKAKKLADRIMKEQQAQVAQMKKLLARIP
ncbi:DUF305 domain-containing protein [Nonomuraea angiospora]|uniref:Uncharacterized protein (DUF305 family) n=1 Tax=Nonomuraea angiospora TaxID=46172 RepID=A0ABR9MLS5_9ACTN|nr:DUF305 domain-containing protein [Nonomuraea angiospora]MBE1593515.1 uncharacterized protein (DUF305 family) [Nonomuraea angiospora]